MRLVRLNDIVNAYYFSFSRSLYIRVYIHIIYYLLFAPSLLRRRLTSLYH